MGKDQKAKKEVRKTAEKTLKEKRLIKKAKRENR